MEYTIPTMEEMLQVATVNMMIREKDAVIIEKDAALVEKDAEIEEKDDKIKKLEDRLNGLKQFEPVTEKLNTTFIIFFF